MGNLVSSAFNVVRPVSGSEGSQELPPTPPPPPPKTEAVHGDLLPGRAEYEFFNETYGLLRPSMQIQYCRLVETARKRPNGPAGDGHIPWSVIDGLGARTYTDAITQTTHLLEIFLKHGNPNYKLDTVQRIRELVGEIIQQWEEEVRQASERSGDRSTEAEKVQQFTLNIWTNVRSTLENSKRNDANLFRD